MRQVLKLVLLITLVFVTPILGTTIVAIRFKNGFVIAADSKVSYPGQGIKGPTTVCKIYRSGKFYFTFSGLAKDEDRGFLPERTVADNLSDSTSFESNISRLELALSHSLKIEMMRIKTDNPEQFELAQKQGNVVTVIVATIVGDTAHVAIRGFKYLDGTNPEIDISRLTCPGDCPNELFGFAAGMQEGAKKSITESFNNFPFNPIETARKAVDSEIIASPDSVGPPISIIGVNDKQGVFHSPEQNGCPIVVEPSSPVSPIPEPSTLLLLGQDCSDWGFLR